MKKLIYLEDAIDAIVGMTTMGIEELVNAGNKERFDWIKGLSDSLVKIINLPSVQPERKTGKWIPVTNGRGGHECDQCHEYAPSWQTGEEHLTNYCPNCGAKMEVEE